MLKNKINKHRDIILLTIGSLLVIFSICLLFYDKVELLKNNVFDEVELLKYQEKNKNNVTPKQEETSDETVIDDVEAEDVEEENPSNNSQKQTNTNTIKKEIIGYLEIKKINLKQGLVSKNSYYNNVNRNIQIIASSDYPDKDNGNVILAAHSGTSSISYFKNLYKLVKGDEAVLYYKGYIYNYKIVNIYNVPKTGTVSIKRDVKKSCLTLITCTHNSKTEQTVYILELVSKTKEGDS